MTRIEVQFAVWINMMEIFILSSSKSFISISNLVLIIGFVAMHLAPILDSKVGYIVRYDGLDTRFYISRLDHWYQSKENLDKSPTPANWYPYGPYLCMTYATSITIFYFPKKKYQVLPSIFIRVSLICQKHIKNYNILGTQHT